MAKYDVDRFETPPDEDLICCICQCVLDNPLESPCRHVFCKVCIETWLTNRNNCPNCRKRLRVSKLKPVLPIVRNMINRLLIVCENREHGCANGIKLEMYDKHVQNCDYAPIKCLNTGCGETVLRQHMLAHEQNCKYRLIMCKKGCGLPISMEKLKKHNCLDELKKNMTAMEEQYKQRLAELESKLNTKIQVLEDRIKAMEENCQQEYGSGWGSARDSYSSLAGFDESDSPSRDLEYTDVQDYDDNNDDDSNSYYYSGNDDNDFETTPEYQEAQADGLTYDLYTQHDPNSEGAQQEEEEIDVEGVGEEEEDRDSDSAFFLNTDAENTNDSDGDLNDSLLDSSDGESEVDEQEGSDPVQVYEVSPTSPNTEHGQQSSQGAATVNQVGDNSYDDVIHVASEHSPHSSTHREHGRRDRQRQSQDPVSVPNNLHGERTSRGGQEAAGVGGGFSPHGNEHSSLCSLHVEYGSSGRSSPRGTIQDYVSDQDNVAEVGNERDDRHSPSISEMPEAFQRNSGFMERLGSCDHRDERSRSRGESGERRHRNRDRGHGSSTSREHHNTSRHSRSRSDHHSRHRARSSSDRKSHSSNNTPASSAVDGCQQTGTEQEDRTGTREYLYGIPVDDTDTSDDPLWERTSRDRSTDLSISDVYTSSDESQEGGSSPDMYRKFLSSLHSVQSSDSDKTWAPGDPDDDAWETDVDYAEDGGYDYQPDENYDNASEHSNEEAESHQDDNGYQEAEERRSSQQESSQESHHSGHNTRSRSHSPTRRGAHDTRARSRSLEQPSTWRDPASRSSDSENVTLNKKRPLAESSSESDNTEEYHWKRRR